MQKLKEYLDSNYFIPVPFILAIISNFFSLELVVYALVTIIVTFVLLFCDSGKPLTSMFIAMYFGTSRKNSPKINQGNTIYTNKASLIYIGILVAIMLFAFVFRFIKRKEYKNINFHNSQLLSGFIFLTLALMCSGLFSIDATYKNTLYGMLVMLSVTFAYFFFMSSTDFSKIDKDYIAFVMLAASVLLCAEISFLFLTVDNIIVGGSIVKSAIVTGWGSQNNISGVLVLTIPTMFYLASTKKYGFLYLIYICVVYLFIIITNCRTAILVGAMILTIGTITLLFKSKSKWGIRFTFGAMVNFVILICLMFWPKLLALFRTTLSSIFSSAGRINIYEIGFLNYLENPIFGLGFYESTPLLNNLGTYIPAKYHNIIIQFMASAGTFGIFAFIFHLSEVIKISLKKADSYRKALFGVVLAFLAINMFDNHFFNIGPSIIYSVILAYINGSFNTTIPEDEHSLYPILSKR